MSINGANDLISKIITPTGVATSNNFKARGKNAVNTGEGAAAASGAGSAAAAVGGAAVGAPTGQYAGGVAPVSKPSGGGGGSWYEALVDAWGRAMDTQAAKIEDLAGQLEGLNDQIKANSGPNATKEQQAQADLIGKTDQPSVLTRLTGASQRFGFLASSASTSINAVGEGNDKLARKG